MKSIRYWVKTIILADLCCGLFAYKNGFASALYCVACSDLRSKIKCLFLLSFMDIAAWMYFLVGLLVNFFEGGHVV